MCGEKVYRIGCSLTAGILIVGVLGIVIYFICLDNWYNKVQAEMPSVKQIFIEMNHEILSHIPVPEGVTEIKTEDLGVKAITEYGIFTMIEYRIDDLGLDIQDYYQLSLEPLGWILIDKYESETGDYAEYSNGEACLHITTYSKEIDEYTIYLDHDFQAQDFIPKLPPMWYVDGFREGGDSYIHTCP